MRSINVMEKPKAGKGMRVQSSADMTLTLIYYSEEIPTKKEIVQQRPDRDERVSLETSQGRVVHAEVVGQSPEAGGCWQVLRTVR